jgi:glycosyltransferase involved in cell wall biosynthesis
MISVLILTKNEAQDLPGCLASLGWCDDIWVFDSYSTDQTVDIARQAGARVAQRAFDNYAAQRNAALTDLDFKHSWLFILDADERVPEGLPTTLEAIISSLPEEVNGISLKRKDYLEGRWLKHAQISPLYIRIVRKGKASYHRAINEVLEVDGHVRDIEAYFDHYPFSKGYAHWLTKHNTYSSMEAARWVEENAGAVHFSLSQALFNKDFNKRRFHQKGLFYKFPGRPLVKWLYMVIWRRAFLDGRAGLTYATLQAIYEYFIVIKSRELLSKPKQ